MKRFLVLLTAIAVMLCGCTLHDETDKETGTDQKTEMRGIWISCYDLQFSDEERFKNYANTLFADIRSYGFNSVFVHVRPFADAFYRSEIFPWSSFLTGTQGKDPGYDPLPILLQAAHEQQLSFHAWINPLRIAFDTDLDKLSSDNPAKQYLTDENPDNDTWVRESGGALYYNPTVFDVQKLIIDGVREIVANYAVDGIHMDDYFYPTTAADFDKKEYEAYCKTTQNPLSLSDFRRTCIDQLVSGIYAAVKAENQNCIFGISPQAKVGYNKNTLYADVEKWCAGSGFVDYIAPQIYYGFEYTKKSDEGESLQFEDCARTWAALADGNIDLYLGLGLYRSGESVENGGAGAGEWIEHTDVIKRQVEFARTVEECGGCIVFSYSSLSGNDNQKAEAKHLKELYTE